MKTSRFSLIVILSFLVMVLFQFACKKESLNVPQKATEGVSKKYFYLEEIKTSGDTSKSDVIVVY